MEVMNQLQATLHRALFRPPYPVIVTEKHADPVELVFQAFLRLDPEQRGRLALLWQIRFEGVCEEFLTVRASHGSRPRKKFEDGLPDGWHARLWRRSPNSFFSFPPP